MSTASSRRPRRSVEKPVSDDREYHWGWDDGDPDEPPEPEEEPPEEPPSDEDAGLSPACTENVPITLLTQPLGTGGYVRGLGMWACHAAYPAS